MADLYELDQWELANDLSKSKTEIWEDLKIIQKNMETKQQFLALAS